ncbi:hypothetical protein HYDPIDRAFT_118729 [Hydnomerulius pinastri MD-312]|uniref:Protein kinase domain-containing protein n=1 Tax=Hydnomerulius pinastri MD-312 TaxID=994086 RepID=A0A0C9W8D7_9AGAM|nr:hypothetical protein HYDPIDRAFT_118729 [Hydnomerulius pinastri MD-312]
MYNLVTGAGELAKALDPNKGGSLLEIKNAACGVVTLNSQTHLAKTAIEEDAEEDEYVEESDDFGIFGADDIQDILRQMNYKIDYIADGHPRLAVVSSKVGRSTKYLKFVEDGHDEVKILQHLSSIRSPTNHTISNIRFWPVHGGTVICMPVAGGWLTSLRNPDKHMGSVAQQLFEAVAFMHEQNVAHLDLKSQNIVIPRHGGRLSIIDFNASVLVKSPTQKFRGIVGTDHYIPPEVHVGKFNPIRADLWTCGKTLRQLCSRCKDSPYRSFLLEITDALMKDDPDERPMMSTVLRWMSSRSCNSSPNIGTPVY